MKDNKVMLHFENVTVRHHGSRSDAVRNCSLGINAGEHVALLGLNGSGKTSVLMAAAGLLPYEGTIHVDGIRLRDDSLGAVRRKLGVLFSTPEDQLLFPRVADDVAFSLMRQGVDHGEAQRRSEQILIAMGIGELKDAAPYELSHGQKMRVALAGALVHEPGLLLLDEPSSALDPPGKRALSALLDSYSSTMLIATHDLAFAEECCTRYILLDAGRVARDTARMEEITL